MKKVVAITALLALLVVSAAVASETQWRFDVTGANSLETGSRGTPAQLGVGLASVLPFSTATDVGAFQVWAAAAGIGADTTLHNKQNQSNATYGSPKTWTAYVAANTSYPNAANGGKMSVQILTDLASYLPPTNQYYEYDIFLDDVFQTTLHPTWIGSPFMLVWSKIVDTRFGGTDWVANGYKVEITQKVASDPNGLVTPEPCSLLALSSGLMGFVCIAVRRRRG